METEVDDCIGTSGKSKTYRRLGGNCGHIYVTLVFKNDKPNRIDYIKLQGCTKTNDCGGTFMDSLSDILTFAVRRIRNKFEADAIIKALSYHRCNRIVPNKDHTTSCVDAIGQVLKEVLIKDAEEKEKENS